MSLEWASRSVNMIVSRFYLPYLLSQFNKLTCLDFSWQKVWLLIGIVYVFQVFGHRKILGKLTWFVGHVCTIVTRPIADTFYSTVNLMMALMKSKVSEIHPLGIVMVSTKFHTDPWRCCWDTSVVDTDIPWANATSMAKYDIDELLAPKSV